MRRSEMPYLAAILVCVLAIATIPHFANFAVKGNPGTIYVPGNYRTIQAAVDAASPGDTIIVAANSTAYSGNITISKSITLVGASPGTTVIDARNAAQGILVNSTGNVVVTGFTIKNSDAIDSEIMIESSTNVVVTGNIIQSNEASPGNGTFVGNSNLVVVRNNTITGNTYGIAVQGGFSNTILSNNVTKNQGADVILGNATGVQVSNNILRRSQAGIDIWASSIGNTVTRNIIANNSIAGIWMLSSYNNLIVNNNIDWNNSTSTSYGIWLQNTSGNQFYSNNIRHNSIQMYGGYSTDMTSNTWNGGGTSPRGNYWSDYTGADNDTDGVGDSKIPWPCQTGGRPCSFSGPPGVDYYPLMNATLFPVLNVTITAAPLTGCSIPSALQVTFTGTAQGGSPPYQYFWRFGDGTSAGNLTSVSHAYNARGELFATLVVNDSKVPANSASETVTIVSFSGGLTLHIKDSTGNPIVDANVTSVVVPPGHGQIHQVSDSSGIVSSPCLPPGPYTFKISRAGFQTQSIVLTVTNSTLNKTVTLLSLAPSQNSFPLYLLEYIGIASTIGIVLVAAFLVLRKSRSRTPPPPSAPVQSK